MYGISALACLACASLSVYALEGHPAYGFFALYKAVLAVSALACAYSLWQSKFMPVGLVLLVLAATHVFGKMPRRQWVPYDLAVFACFAMAGILFLALWRGSRLAEPKEHTHV